jgi:hypothetical protein
MSAGEWTVDDAKALRDASGAGLADCRKALTWARANVDLAAWYLKNCGHAVARRCTRCDVWFNFPDVVRGANGAVLHDCEASR